MSAETILFVLVAAVLSLALAVFMYGYKTKYSRTLKWLFGSLRFVALFAILLLLINPKFKSDVLSVEKPKLPVVLDNSSSIVALEQEESVNNWLNLLKSNEDLSEKFDIFYFTFGNSFRQQDTLSFDESNTNISDALKSVEGLFGEDLAPTILITDGNQTLGSDYEFTGLSQSNPLYPVILGDSTKYTDLRIEQLNTNRYAFLKNQFPVEAILVYSGESDASSEFVVTQGGVTVYRESVIFTETDNTRTINFTLPASSVGLQRYNARILPLPDEKNNVNNSKRFAVEVIDQATNVLVVSKMVHPDLGALKKSITSNEQRTINVQKPDAAVSVLEDHQLVVLFQPDRSFSAVYSEIERLKKNVLVITGRQTDWNYLNSIQSIFNKESTRQSEEVTAALNANYGTFGIEDIGFDSFPPLATSFGSLTVLAPHEVLLEQTVAGFATENPMLATMEVDGRRLAIWDGEGIWKWRAQTFLANDSFEEFDNFIGKLVQYLASQKRRSRLEVNSETFYYNNNSIQITAQYFDNNFVFDSRAALQISVRNTNTNERRVFPLLLRNNYYTVDLNSLPAGEYSYTVSVADQAVSRSGNFTILDFNVEQQFLNADVTKLQNVATNTNGKAFFSTQYEALIEDLLADDRYRPIQKSEQKIVPLIDWKYLLAIIVLTLTAEWFIRKYNGLI